MSAQDGKVSMDSMKDVGRQPYYLSYLLRLWRDTDDMAVWRASVQSPLTGERIHLTSLQDLFSYLRRQTTASTEERDR